MGDYFFDSHLLIAARTNYECALDSPILRAYAGYRLGWIAFNEHDYEGALAAFQITWDDSADNRALRRQVLDDMVLAVAYLPDGSTRTARLFRSWTTETFVIRQLERLSVFQAEMGLYDNCRLLLIDLIETYPNHVNRVGWDAGAVSDLCRIPEF